MTPVDIALFVMVITISVCGQVAPARIVLTKVNVFDGYSDSLATNVSARAIQLIHQILERNCL